MDEVLKEALRSGAAVKVGPMAKALSCSKAALYQAIKSGEVRSIRIRGAIRVPNAEARRLLGLPEAA